MQKRTAKAWPFRPKADETEDPYSLTHEVDPAKWVGAMRVARTVQHVNRKNRLLGEGYSRKPSWPEWQDVFNQLVE